MAAALLGRRHEPPVSNGQIMFIICSHEDQKKLIQCAFSHLVSKYAIRLFVIGF